MNLITTAKEIITKKISLQTRTGNDIDNLQYYGLSDYYINQINSYDSKIGSDIKRAQPSGLYNCHGLVFASRRTNIENTSEIIKIVSEDNYHKINYNDAKPGDVILYKNNGEYIHSGIILSGKINFITDSSEPAKVLSKLGCYSEVVHDFNKRYYDYDEFEIIRIDDHDYGRE